MKQKLLFIVILSLNNVIWELLTNDGAGYDISYNSGKIK
jgi:hypothetical protein